MDGRRICLWLSIAHLALAVLRWALDMPAVYHSAIFGWSMAVLWILIEGRHEQR